MVLDDMIKARPFLAFFSLLLLICTGFIVLSAWLNNTVSEERYTKEMSAKADTSYVIDKIEIHRIESEGEISRQLDTIIKYVKP